MPPYAIKSTGNYLYISFISDHKVTGKGFKIIWEADGPSSARVATTARPKKTVTGIVSLAIFLCTSTSTIC